MNRAPRPQDQLSVGTRLAQRARPDARSPIHHVAPLNTTGRAPEAQDNNQGRAAKFEDEKRRIVESLFSKRDPDGVQVESYITHVRVTEDAQYATTPPPPESNPSNKKSRVILVAVRRSGRVKVHKARENPNGTFSIGKTWYLDDLSTIQSYTNLIPRNDHEELEKTWAGNTGFIVALGKPYYWQVPTAKEKDFFIASLIKIYRKYTGGKLPQLYGFAPNEVDGITGVQGLQSSPDPQTRSSSVAATLVSPPPIPAASERRPQSPYSVRSTKDESNKEQEQEAKSTDPPRLDTTVTSREMQAQLHQPELTSSPARPAGGQPVYDLVTDHQPPSESSPPLPVPAHTPYLPPHLESSSRMTPSPQSSQTSLPISERQKPSLTNGAPARARLPFADPVRNVPSIASVSSRPSTATSEQKSLDTRSDVATPQDGSHLPDRLELHTTNQDSRPGLKSGAASVAETQFATPAITPSELEEDKTQTLAMPSVSEALSQAQDYFSPKNKQEEPAATPTTNVSGTTVESALSPLSPSETTAKSGESYRPGLGPMVKKKSAKDIAGQFRRAALAATAFQPRQGGGAARLKALQEKDKTSSEPDGITGVVPAPLLRGLSSDVKSPATPTLGVYPDKPSSPTPTEELNKPEISRTATQDSISVPDISAQKQPVAEKLPGPSASKPKVEQNRSPSPEKARSKSPQRRKRQRQEAELSKYCTALNIDYRVLDVRGGDYNDLLTEFGWKGRLSDQRRVEDFEAEIKREIGRAQATGWLGHIEQQESKILELSSAFDKAIEECEELDGLFTLYSHELETLAADIEYIEAQSQGLQVQAANQKLLQKELTSLLQMLTISSSDLRELKSGSLNSVTDVGRIEQALVLLYKALSTIDPDMRQDKARHTGSAAPDRAGPGVYAATEVSQMRAVREKKQQYGEETKNFTSRFRLHMEASFAQVEARVDQQKSALSPAATTLDSTIYQSSRSELWPYSALVLFTREVEVLEWQGLISMYKDSVKKTYQGQFRDYVMSNRRLARKMTGEELEALFTTQEKEKPDEGRATAAARKLTVRRGKTVKNSALKTSLIEKRDGKPDGWEVFGTILQQQAKVIAEEQNFVACFFHVNSQMSTDFAEIVNLSPPASRRLPNFGTKQSYDPDRTMAQRVYDTTEGIFGFWLNDMQSLVEWCLSVDQMQGVGVLSALEQCLAIYEETNQEYIARTLRALHDRLTGLFHKFIDEQIKGVEETKVKVNRRRGIIAFMRTFPIFSAMVEHMIPRDMPGSGSLEVRFIANDAYSRILKAMWESLTFIAKDDPAARGGASQSTLAAGGDPEDKEALNHHILLIENMNHYLEEVDTQKNIVLEEWADRAKQDMTIHLTQYTDAVIRRPLGKWLDFLESTEAMMKANDGSINIANRPSHSRSTAKKVLSAHSASEIRKGIEVLKKRIEKHFGEFEEPTPSSKHLIMKVLEECGYRYTQAHGRMKTIIDIVYDGNLEIEWRAEEAAALFKQQ